MQKKLKRFLLSELCEINSSLKSIYLSNKQDVLESISPNTYAFALLLIASFNFIISGTHTAFEWTTTQDIPAILKLLDPSFLDNDFYTNSVIGSPRFLFSHLVYMMTFLGVGWYPALYFLKTLCILTIPPFLFLTIYRITSHWLPKQLLPKERELIKFVIFLCSTPLLSALQGNISSEAPFGWGAIQSYHFLSPMTLSFVVGLLYLMAFFSRDKLTYFSPMLLALSTTFHPVIGLCHFAITIIFCLPLLSEKRKVVQIGLDFLIGIVAPITLLIILFKGPSALEADKFIDYYVFVRHPHHYLMSESFDFQSVKWILLFIIPFYMSFKSGQRAVVFLSVLNVVAFLCAPLLQFLGTEIWKIKVIAELGPSRFTAFVSILWAMNTIIAITYYAKNRKELSHKRINNFSTYASVSAIYDFAVNVYNFLILILSRIEGYVKNKAVIFLCTLFVICSTFYVTYAHPLEQFKNTGLSDLIKWVSENTSPDSVFIAHHLDTMLIRVYGNRAVFADKAFPFNEVQVEEFNRRYLLYLKSFHYHPPEYACLAESNDVDYVILPIYKKFEQYDAKFSSERWLVYDISDFNKMSSSCQNTNQ